MLVYEELFYWMIMNKNMTHEMATITTGREGFEKIKEQDATPDLVTVEIGDDGRDVLHWQWGAAQEACK